MQSVACQFYLLSISRTCATSPQGRILVQWQFTPACISKIASGPAFFPPVPLPNKPLSLCNQSYLSLLPNLPIPSQSLEENCWVFGSCLPLQFYRLYLTFQDNGLPFRIPHALSLLWTFAHTVPCCRGHTYPVPGANSRFSISPFVSGVPLPSSSWTMRNDDGHPTGTNSSPLGEVIPIGAFVIQWCNIYLSPLPVYNRDVGKSYIMPLVSS